MERKVHRNQKAEIRSRIMMFHCFFSRLDPLCNHHSPIEICVPRGTRLTPKPDEGFDPVSWISVLPTSPLVAFIEGRGDDGAVHEPPHLLGSRSQFAVYA